MRELWLSENKAGDSGVKHLSSLLEDPNSKLDKTSVSIKRPNTELISVNLTVIVNCHDLHMYRVTINSAVNTSHHSPFPSLLHTHTQTHTLTSTHTYTPSHT